MLVENEENIGQAHQIRNNTYRRNLYDNFVQEIKVLIAIRQFDFIDKYNEEVSASIIDRIRANASNHWKLCALI
jgi:hypothetical protein